MGFVKVVKNRAYFKRFQVKYKRRRECKTDYYARKRLIIQDKNKYNTPKYRFVVRFSNRDIICQIFFADLTHDVCVAAAYSHELPAYGLKHGLKNYSAAYCTGLLLARRVNKKFNLDYTGKVEADGEDFHVEAVEEGNAPFKALLDVGLKRTSTGNRIFGALKGACDGGLDIPHNDRRFPGTKKEAKDYQPDPAVHRKYIYGGHVAEYMTKLKEDDEEAYGRQFSQLSEAGVEGAALEAIYKKCHAAIRKNPSVARDPLKLGYFGTREAPRSGEPKKVRKNRVKLSATQRHSRIRQKLTAKGKQPMEA
jgi:large subunit ribosomal protein L5e